MNYAYLSTGGNMGRRKEQLALAAQLLEERCGTIIDRSALYETEPWGKPDQELFLNQALILETSLTARELMNEIIAIEIQMGRNRAEKYGPRVIDIDILLFNHEIINEPGLCIPHTELYKRRFVLVPLNEIAPAYIHPVFYKTVQQLLEECPDRLTVKKL
jgi:2-amino-4-hydroxy-6-hydroxymethyldihydropteridine diphosphokinase